MAPGTLEDVMQSIDNSVKVFRGTDYDLPMYEFPNEYTHWLEEQRAVMETCAIVDQSFHMAPMYLEGPEAIDLFEDIGTNSFDNIRNGSPPIAKNVVFCAPDGNMIRDVILFYVGDEQFVSAGTEIPTHWQQYKLETGDYDATGEVPYVPGSDDDPREFRFQIQGPSAPDVMDEVTEGTGVSEDASFFGMDEVTIAGADIYILKFGMAAAPGYELFGDFAYHDAVEETILETGTDYGIHRMGSKAYKTNKIGSGWIHQPVPAIYESEEMKAYREWLPEDCRESKMSIGGSYVSEDLSDYYMNPVECGQGHLVDLDHDFVGRDALAEILENPRRQCVTFVWDVDDVVDVYASLFREGDTKKFIDLPDTARQWSLSHYDEVLRDGEVVGLSKYPGYLEYEREYLSLGIVDVEHSDPGTELTLVWGEDNSRKQKVERHVETEIDVTVGPAPYVQG